MKIFPDDREISFHVGGQLKWSIPYIDYISGKMREDIMYVDINKYPVEPKHLHKLSTKTIQL